MAEAVQEQEAQAEAPQASGGKKKLVIIVAGLVLVIAGAGIALSMMGGDDELDADAAAAEAAPPQSIYIDLEPEFVINFRDKNDRAKFLKAELSVSTTEEDVEEAVGRHMPAIRNSLVLLLSRQIYDDLVPHEGKERLRAQALSEVQAVLKAQIGKPGVDDLYFSNFVMH